MRLRSAVRALVVDDAERLALVRFEFPDRVVWATPGGGLEEGENDVAALARELREELGFELREPLGTPVWVRTHVFPFGDWDGQTERFYLLRTPGFTFHPALSTEELLDEGVAGLRWWTPDEPEARFGAGFAPRLLPTLLRALLVHGPPPHPIDVGV